LKILAVDATSGGVSLALGPGELDVCRQGRFSRNELLPGNTPQVSGNQVEQNGWPIASSIDSYTIPTQNSWAFHHLIPGNLSHE